MLLEGSAFLWKLAGIWYQPLGTPRSWHGYRSAYRWYGQIGGERDTLGPPWALLVFSVIHICTQNQDPSKKLPILLESRWGFLHDSKGAHFQSNFWGVQILLRFLRGGGVPKTVSSFRLNLQKTHRKTMGRDWESPRLHDTDT